MVTDRLSRGVLYLVVIGVLAIAFAGCGGGGEAVTPPVPPGTSTVTGRVVDATDVAQGLANAQVSTNATSGRSGRLTTMSDSNGGFTLTGVPAGVVRIQARAATTSYRDAVVDVDVPSGESVAVVISLVPVAVSAPASVTVSPVSVSVQENVPRAFTATVRDAQDNVLSLTPTWTVSARLGSISSSGEFVGTTQGSGTVSATSGTATGTSLVAVTGATAPQISAVTAAPTTLGPRGGNVLFTAQVQSGGQIQSAALRVLAPGATTPVEVALTPLSGSTEYSASYEYTYALPANSSSGYLTDDTYSVTVVATDVRSLSGESIPLSVVVLAVEPPPGEPS